MAIRDLSDVLFMDSEGAVYTYCLRNGVKDGASIQSIVDLWRVYHG